LIEERGEVARELMTQLIKGMGLKAELNVSIKGDAIYLDIKGEKEEILIGKRGRTLEALQFLLNRMVNKQLEEGVRVFIDINQYKERRANSLTNMAVRLGERVKRGQKPLTIGPFNAHDRRIIHLALKEDPALTTESLGEGEMKRIRIVPKSQVR